MSSDEVVKRLIDEAGQIGVEVYEANGPSHFKDLILELLFKRYAQYSSVCLALDQFLVTHEITHALKTKGWDVLLANSYDDFQQFLEKLKHVHIGITPVDLCIAETCTLVIRNNRPYLREISLLPPVHFAIVRKDQIVFKIEDAGEIIDKWLNESFGVTFITGPSRTADIELNLVKGVHGPKELIVFILSQC